MRHHNSVRKFGRSRDQRKALIRGLARNLIVHERIITTEAKAKELRPFIEKLVTAGKEATVADRRLVTSRLMNRVEDAKKLINDITPRYLDRAGGYTRITKLPPRAGDASPMAVIEFV